MDKGKVTNKGKQTVTEIEKNLGNLLVKLQTTEKDLKPQLEKIKIENASEIVINDGKRCYLVYVSSPTPKDLKQVHNLLVIKFEEHFSTPVVIIPAKKTIDGKIYRKYRGTKVPRDRTLTAVYDSYLDDIIYPATLIGKRIRYPKGKGRQFKIFVDPLDKEIINYKVQAITACYKSITNRELQVDFPEIK